MGIFGALTTAVTGLSAQAFALENISGNIANSQTTGYKRIDSSFADMIGDSSGAANKQIAGAVTSYSRSTNSLQGSVNNSSSATNMAINGTGYFVVQQKIGMKDGKPIFSGTDVYTRRGDFQLDKNGYMVNGSGYYLKGLSVNATTGAVSSSIPEVLALNANFMAASQTSSIKITGNLPNEPRPSRWDSTNDAATRLLNFTATGMTAPTTTDVTGTTAADAATKAAAFVASSIDGGAVSCYDQQGSTVNIQTRWAKTENGNGTTTTDKWAMYYYTGDDAGTPWKKVGDYEFNFNGSLKTPATGTVSVPNMTVNGRNLGTISIDHSGGLTQTFTTNRTASMTLDQNGNPAGSNATVNIDSDGRVNAVFNNGRSQPLAQIPLATFKGENFLKKLDGGAFASTSESGSASLTGTGSIQGKALEGSNVDVSEEFTKLIVTSRPIRPIPKLSQPQTRCCRKRSI